MATRKSVATKGYVGNDVKNEGTHIAATKLVSTMRLTRLGWAICRNQYFTVIQTLGSKQRLEA